MTRLDAMHSDSPVHYHTIYNLIAEEILLSEFAQHDLDAELLLANIEDVCSFAKAQHDMAWRTAMQEQIETSSGTAPRSASV